MKPRRKQRTHDHIEIKSPVELFHLARLLEGGINPLTMMVSGGILDLSMDLPPMESSQLRYAVAIFEGVLTSDQIVKVPNLTKWWWVQNTTSGNFTLKMQTPLGVPTAVPRNSGWQLVHCDGKDNIAVSPQNNLPKKFGAREWSGPGRERALTEILDLAGVPFDGRTRTGSHVAILQPPTAETDSLFLGGLNDPRVGGLNHQARLAFRGLSPPLFRPVCVFRVVGAAVLAGLRLPRPPPVGEPHRGNDVEKGGRSMIAKEDRATILRNGSRWSRGTTNGEDGNPAFPRSARATRERQSRSDGRGR